MADVPRHRPPRRRPHLGGRRPRDHPGARLPHRPARLLGAPVPRTGRRPARGAVGGVRGGGRPGERDRTGRVGGPTRRPGGRGPGGCSPSRAARAGR
ncbi:hypothetical protein M4D82_18645 [Streptomyces sp. RerS4]|nr:hypothetical protein M4D82_18645 [Streptomyces sp. RerS4]